MADRYNSFIGHPIEDIYPTIIGTSDDAIYILGYLKEIGATFCIEEKNYIDKEFLIDYSMFYARSFEDINKYTTRLHFFKHEITEVNFFELIDNFHKSEFRETELEKLNDNYLGFLVVKPVIGSNKQPLLGRTLLKPYPKNIGDEIRKHVKKTYPVSLYGLPLKIDSLPFQMQDQSVGACATTSCWVSLYPLNDLFGTSIHSLAEITEKSTTFPGLNRNFPSSGLSVFQIKNFYNSIGLETEFIDIKPQIIAQFGGDYPVIPTLVKAYIDFGLPVIACIDLQKTRGDLENRIPPDFDQHAAVISGYRHKKGAVTEFYAHDDRIGPYSRIKPLDSDPKKLFIDWNCEWLNRRYDTEHDKKYITVRVESLIIPVYPKLRLKFMDIYVIFKDYVKKATVIDASMSYQLLLEDINKYKLFLLKRNFTRKKEVSMERFPKYLWIIRSWMNNKIVNDRIFDATCNYQKGAPYENIDFNNTA